MAMFASIRDIKAKEVWQFRKLKAMGINGLSIGVESGDDETLALADKGYTAADILEQCRKLDEAGIEYYFVYMTGLSGKGSGYRNAVNSARLFSQLNPYFISVDFLTLFQGQYDLLPEANGEIMRWITDNHYRLDGKRFNIYHVSPETEESTGNMVTEVCFPVKPL